MLQPLVSTAQSVELHGQGEGRSARITVGSNSLAIGSSRCISEMKCLFWGTTPLLFGTIDIPSLFVNLPYSQSATINQPVQGAFRQTRPDAESNEHVLVTGEPSRLNGQRLSSRSFTADVAFIVCTDIDKSSEQLLQSVETVVSCMPGKVDDTRLVLQAVGSMATWQSYARILGIEPMFGLNGVTEALELLEHISILRHTILKSVSALHETQAACAQGLLSYVPAIACQAVDCTMALQLDRSAVLGFFFPASLADTPMTAAYASDVRSVCTNLVVDLDKMHELRSSTQQLSFALLSSHMADIWCMPARLRALAADSSLFGVLEEGAISLLQAVQLVMIMSHTHTTAQQKWRQLLHYLSMLKQETRLVVPILFSELCSLREIEVCAQGAIGICPGIVDGVIAMCSIMAAALPDVCQLVNGSAQVRPLVPLLVFATQAGGARFVTQAGTPRSNTPPWMGHTHTMHHIAHVGWLVCVVRRLGAWWSFWMNTPLMAVGGAECMVCWSATRSKLIWLPA